MFLIALRKTTEDFSIIAEELKDYQAVVRTLERFSCNDIEAIDIRYYQSNEEKELFRSDYNWVTKND